MQFDEKVEVSAEDKKFFEGRGTFLNRIHSICNTERYSFCFARKHGTKLLRKPSPKSDTFLVQQCAFLPHLRSDTQDEEKSLQLKSGFKKFFFLFSPFPLGEIVLITANLT